MPAEAGGEGRVEDDGVVWLSELILDGYLRLFLWSR